MNIYFVKTIILFLMLITGIVYASDENENYPPKTFKNNLSIGDFTIGSTSISEISNQYGVEVFKSKDPKGASFKHICLVTNINSTTYLITLKSGAMGGWDILSEYSIEKISVNKDVTQCRNYTKNNISYAWVLYDAERVIELYGEPNFKKNNHFEYKYKYDEFDIEKKTQFYVYSGISFKFDKSRKVIKLDVFKVEST